MKAIRTIRASTPLIAQLGLAVLLMGFLADLVVHLSAPADHGHAASTALTAHLITVLGMVLVLAGVIQVAAKALRRSRRKGGTNAARRSTATARSTLL
jgi:predicted phage tail protein